MILVIAYEIFENCKIIRSKDVLFNEKVMYKDQLKGKKVEKENTEYTMLDEIKENEIPKVLENKEQWTIPQTPTSVRSCTKLSRPLE